MIKTETKANHINALKERIRDLQGRHLKVLHEHEALVKELKKDYAHDCECSKCKAMRKVLK